MSNIKDKLLSTMYILIVSSPFIIGGLLLIIWIYTLVVYGDKPITEIPSWAFFFMGGNR